MKLVKYNQASKFYSNDKCVGYEYRINDKDIDMSTATITGRYPTYGYCYNEECKEIIYVIDGNGILNIKGKSSIEFNEHDVFLIEKGDIYYWDGNCTVVMCCTPAWYPTQHKLVE